MNTSNVSSTNVLFTKGGTLWFEDITHIYPTYQAFTNYCVKFCQLICIHVNIKSPYTADTSQSLLWDVIIHPFLDSTVVWLNRI